MGPARFSLGYRDAPWSYGILIQQRNKKSKKEKIFLTKPQLRGYAKYCTPKPLSDICPNYFLVGRAMHYCSRLYPPLLVTTS
jgi:hypothetical protein